MSDKEKFLLESCDKLHQIKAFNAAILKVQNEIDELLSAILELDTKQYNTINNKSNNYIDDLKQELLIYIEKC